jgi:diacylglycerol kinase (ATP)
LQNISFIIHGLNFNKGRIKAELEKTFSREYKLSFYETTTSREAEQLSENSILNGTNYMIAVGGDGTLSEVINGVMRTPKEKRENIIVGLLPEGSGNDFARTMNLTKNIAHLYGFIKSNKVINIDIGKLEFKTMQGVDAVRYFDNITDVGLGAEVAKRVNEGNKTYGPNLAFFSATILGFLNYRRKKIKIESANFSWEGKILILCIANGKYFGSGLGIAPHAKVNDGKFGITLAGEISIVDYLKNLLKIRKCLPLSHPQIIYNEVESCLIQPVGEECLIEADGEMIGKIPLRATVLPGEIKFLSHHNTR